MSRCRCDPKVRFWRVPDLAASDPRPWPLGSLWSDELGRCRAQRLCQFKQGHDSRVALTPLQVTYVLLGETRELCELLLGEAEFRAGASHVLPDHPAHIHAAEGRSKRPWSLSHIVCNLGCRRSRAIVARWPWRTWMSNRPASAGMHTGY